MSKHAELIERVMNVPCYTEEDAKALAAIADALEAQEREIEALRKDAERLEYVYSSNQTTSNALVELEFRLLNGESPSMSEVRAAIDAAKGVPHGIPPTT